ncbi:hypothetical protein L0P54_02265 [Anaerosalibacter bizertensis]|uniref:Uncharacterized protein n=1 Tax=Anaerosalibacter bizertensis TaxID=932217 RepID=A0A9Q4AAW5_9FIRM|nr:hypothetical protein [Anaerosalibacter bizertensis]MBV1817471.1 hypothetical protein [Bacteroidales bacterium MSK.15.36]MBU5293375.1 hypothetical protein [Anaerosalibacter bizertensis]MCB5560083.1 hypothetical protein [Anaerosalibacter bizertensis]MCG4564017.1 hypothetical protein [Anaerosalibacter bizertensis]MCG4581797.1 hypothetical protein [Anaerosalibacter bizertensis]
MRPLMTKIEKFFINIPYKNYFLIAAFYLLFTIVLQYMMRNARINDLTALKIMALVSIIVDIFSILAFIIWRKEMPKLNKFYMLALMFAIAVTQYTFFLRPV